MQKLHEILQFMPLNGSAGDVLQRTVDGAAWMPLTAVSLDIHGLNSTTPDPADELPIYDNSLQGNYKVTVQDIIDMMPADTVTSVNGQTGAVVLDATDVGALPDTTSIPSQTSDLVNDSGFIDAAGAAAAAPVQSVNGQTGAVTISPTDFRTFTEYYPSTGDVSLFTSDDITNLECEMTVAVSSNKKFLRVGGFLSFDTGATSGWKYIRLGYTVSDLYFDFTHPASMETIMYPAIMYDEDNLPIFQTNQWNTRINVYTSGAIVLAVYLGGTTAGLRRKIALPSVLIQTAT